MKLVQYINNTCDLEGWGGGEQAVVIYNDKIIYSHDHSDGFIDVTDSKKVYSAIQRSLKTKEDIEFEVIAEVSPELMNKIRKFLNF